MPDPRPWIAVAALLLSLLANGCGNSDMSRRTNTPEASDTATPAPAEPAQEAPSDAPAESPPAAPQETPADTPPEPSQDTGTTPPPSTPPEPPTYAVTASAGAGGSITPANLSIAAGQSAVLTLIPDAGFIVASVTASGCSGTRVGNVYTTLPLSGNCTVVASFAALAYTVTANAGSGGSISPASVAVVHGTSTTLHVTPDTGFTIGAVSATGCTGTLAGTTYTTGAITAECTVTASFVANTYTVSATAGAGGSIAPESVSVAHGASTTLTVTPASGFHIAAVTPSGCTGTLAGTTYTTGPITAHCVVTATFAATPLIVTAQAESGGGISPASLSVASGETAVFTVAPDTGYRIAGISASGCTGTLMGTTYTTDPVDADCVVTASFVANTYTVSATAGAGGSISPGGMSVSHGDTAILTVTPDAGFGVADISSSGCGGTLAGTTYTTMPIVSDCAITASFAEVATVSLAARIATGGSHSCVLTHTGTVQCWGNNSYGELGNGSTANSLIPVTVTGLSGTVTALAAGAQHSCALTSAGSVLCWGYNAYGQLGTGTTTSSATPRAVTGLSGPVTALVAGGYHTCALTDAGAVQCWGYNANGQLGNGGLSNSATPVAVGGLSGSATLLAAGAQHTCALTDAGVVQCWGNNASGQLGNGSTTRATTPVIVGGLSGTATALAAGASHTCARTSTNAVQCWGLNTSGQLGNGGTANSTVPASAIGLSSAVTALAAGASHTCARTATGGVECWGGNNYGQLGNDSTTASPAPAPVTGLSGAAIALSAGYGHNCVITDSGAAQCWGYNLYGQLGNGSTSHSPTPTTVTSLGGP